MKAFIAVVLVLVLLAGCKTPPTGAPTEVDGYRREDHPAFTPEDKAIVSTARLYLEQSRGESVDAYYRVKREERGWSVSVLGVHRYKGSQPMFTIGRDWLVKLGEDRVVKSVSQGY
jgi:hypothetical protein